MKIIDDIRQSLKNALSQAGVSSENIKLEHTENLEHGDYATSVALAYAKQLQMNPRALAEKIVASLGSIDGVAKIEIAGPGFINFTLENSCVYETLKRDDSWGKNSLLSGKKIMVEYTDPNPFKVFHIGHLMSNAIGESIARLHEAMGARVIRANYQGDVGPHVAKAIYGLLQKGLEMPTIEELGAAYVAGDQAYESGAKEEIDRVNKAVYERTDEKINALYDYGRKISLEHFEELYEMLGTKFDHYFFESVTGPRGLEIVKKHPDVFPQSEGATIFKGEEHGFHTRVFVNKLGLPTYEAKDLGLAVQKKETAQFNRSITITAQEQADYFKVVLKALELVHPEWKGDFTHVSHGMMRFAEGKMSSRKGNVITGESLLENLKEVALERSSDSRADNIEKLAEQVAVAAVKFQILRGGTSKDIIFDRERALSVEGDSGPYLQYAYARTCAILEKAGAANVTPAFDSSQSNALARLLIRFPDIVARAQEELQPHHVANYLISIAAAFNSWYAQEQILDGTLQAAHKVALTDAVRITLKNGLWLLGIPAPEKM